MTLLTTEEVRDYAGIETDGEDPMLSSLVARVEAAFHAAIGRTDRPFQEVENGRVEVHDGTGTDTLYLDYPIAALTTAVTLGYASPWDESLDPTDPEVLQFGAGSRRLSRVDGGTFGDLDRPRYVRVTYDAGADVPEDVKLAVLRMVKALYEESGRGEATAERQLAESEGLPTVADVLTNDVWRAAIEAHREIRV